MDVDQFVAAAVRMMERDCGLVAAYLIGSFAAGDVAAGASDIDLLLVTEQDHPPDRRRLAGERLADLAAHAPMHGVEAVLYRADVLARPSYPLDYQLNVNAGPDMARSVSTAGDAAFWFLLDIAAARQHAVALLGPPVDRVVGLVADDDVRRALLDSLRWHRMHGRHDADAVLNAGRAWHWVASGTWLSKTAAGEWLLTRRPSDTVRAALAARRAGRDATLEAEGVRRLQDEVAAAIVSSGDVHGR